MVEIFSAIAMANSGLSSSGYNKEHSIYDAIYNDINTRLHSHLKDGNLSQAKLNELTLQFEQELKRMFDSAFTSAHSKKSNLKVINYLKAKYRDPKLITKIAKKLSRKHKDNESYILSLVTTLSNLVIEKLNYFELKVLPELDKKHKENAKKKHNEHQTRVADKYRKREEQSVIKKKRRQEKNKKWNQKKKSMKKTWNKRVNAHVKSINKKKKKKSKKQSDGGNKMYRLVR
jgi:hypothetical protein